MFFFILRLFLGDGVFVSLVILTSWFFDKKFAVQLLIAFVVSFLLVWTGKFFIFPGIQRPIAVFEQNKLPLYLAKNSSMSRFYSFPFGHAFPVVCMDESPKQLIEVWK